MSLFIRARAFFRRQYFKRLSGNYSQMEGKPYLSQPLLIKGKGRVCIGKSVQLGYELSPGFWTSYVYFDLRGETALIKLGENPCHVIRTLT